MFRLFQKQMFFGIIKSLIISMSYITSQINLDCCYIMSVTVWEILIFQPRPHHLACGAYCWQCLPFVFLSGCHKHFYINVPNPEHSWHDWPAWRWTSLYRFRSCIVGWCRLIIADGMLALELIFTCFIVWWEAMFLKTPCLHGESTLQYDEGLTCL